MSWCNTFCGYFLLFLYLFEKCQSQTIESDCSGKNIILASIDVLMGTISATIQNIPPCSDADEPQGSNSFNCIVRGKLLAFLEIAYNLASDVRRSYSLCQGKSDIPYPQPIDCEEVLENGNKKSGLYLVFPRSRHFCEGQSLQVYCDMETDGGGWTLIERKGNLLGLQDYNQWQDVSRRSKDYYGDINGNFYIGKENAQALTNQGKYSLRDDEVDSSGKNRAAFYEIYYVNYEPSTSYSIFPKETINADPGFNQQNLVFVTLKIRRRSCT